MQEKKMGKSIKVTASFWKKPKVKAQYAERLD
jgi:hypothetical protein